MKRIPALQDWIRRTPPAQREAICAEIGTTKDYLWQLAGGHSLASAKLAIAIEEGIGLPRTLLRPDIFGPSPNQPVPAPAPHPVDGVAA